MRYAKKLINKKFVFTEPKVAVEMKELWKTAYENPVKAFIRERIEFVPFSEQQDYFIPTEELYKEYMNFSERYMAIEMFSKEFKKYTMGKVEKKKKRWGDNKNSVNGFLGVKIKESGEVNEG